MKRRDPFRFPILESWVGRVVYAPRGQPARYEAMQAVIALRDTDIPRWMAVQRIARAAGISEVEVRRWWDGHG